MFEHVFYEIALILGLTAILGTLVMFLRQPLIVAFLFTGVIAGPSWLSLIKSHNQIELLAQIGISLLLFVVGLRLDLRLIKTTGPVALATGLGQIIFTTLFGFLITYWMGFSVIGSLYISVALTFSSTIIIVKLLSDKKEIDSLHGRIAVGFLIVQDIVAILAMIMLIAIGGGADSGGATISKIVFIAGKGFGLLAAVGLLMRYVLPGLTKKLAFNQELLVVFSIAWAVFLGAVGDFLGFSKEVGAFLGGISLASTGYREAIAARLVSVRDFLLLFFFIDLGARFNINIAGPQVANAIYLSVFVLIGNPLIVMAIMGVMGYRRRTGFMAGLTVAQISEFSLILAALGLNLGHIDMGAMSLITLVGVITICISSYMIIYSNTIYKYISPMLKIFEKKTSHREEIIDNKTCSIPEVDVLIIGLGRYGTGIATHLIERKKSIAGVDFDPQALQTWNSLGIPVLFGDVGDPEFIDNLPLYCSSWIVSTVRDRDLNLTILHLLKERKYEGRIALTAADEDEARLFFSKGAHIVLKPFSDASEEAADSLTEAMHLFPGDTDWGFALKEVRLKKGSVYAGHRLKEIDLGKNSGIYILAVSRAGRVHIEPEPDFQLFPGDRLVLMGEASTLKHAEEILQEVEYQESGLMPKRFATAEIEIAPKSPIAGRTLAEIKFRRKYSATIIGIIRNSEQIPMPKSDAMLHEGDRLVVIGNPESVERLQKTSPL